MIVQDITSNLTDVRARIARAAAASGRSPEAVRLIAVSKTFGMDHVRAAVQAGQREFGENRVQEALEKVTGSGDLGLTWHLIGHLQTNKVRKAVGPFPWIHSVDSVDLLRRIDAVAGETGHAPELLVQVDLAGEVTKHGADVAQVRQILEAAATCTAARLVGLMILPPFIDDLNAVRPFFRQLRDLRDTLILEGVPPAALRELSMGMSHDFEVAIEEGSTMVRVGSAIFGGRHV